MKKLPVLLLPALFILPACEDDVLRNVSSQIVIEPVDRVSATGSIDASKNLINLGESAQYSGAVAMFRVRNPSSKQLNIYNVKKTASHGTARFEVSYPKTVAIDLAGEAEQYIYVHYIPMEEWTDSNGNGVADTSELESAVFQVESDADNGTQEIRVTGYGVYKGYPDLQVCFGDYCGPDNNLECYTATGAELNELNSGTIYCTTQTLDFGNIGLGEVGTQFISLRNVADCPRPEGTELCEQETLCQVVVDKNVDNGNIGFGFLDKTNELHRFSIQGSSSLPATLVQSVYKSNCGGQVISELPVRLNYEAPLTVSQDEATLVIESNDPLNPTIYVPVKATAKNAPEAICAFRTGDGYTNIDNISPLQNVYFDGTNSRDPQAKEDAQNNGISRYEWRITKYPDGTNVNDFSPNPANQAGPYFQFWLPLAGKYEVALTVYDKDNTPSGETEKSKCTFEVKPSSKLHVQLVWDHPTNDQDLHLVYMDKSDIFCDKGADCYWDNEAPIWFTSDAAGEGANPRLDIDDTFGMGPENVNIDTPNPGRYRVFVHYFGAAGSGATENSSQSSSSPAGLSATTRNTIRIYINGLIQGEYHREMSSLRDLWAVADIIWNSDGSAQVVPLDGDQAETTGWLCQNFSCADNSSCEATK